MANEVAKSKVGTFNEYFMQRAKTPEFKSIMAKHLTPERVAKMGVAAAMRNPTLLQCNPQSVWLQVANAASLGLEVNLLGGAYLVPFRNNKTNSMDCQLIVGYQGLIDLIRRSGHVQQIEAHVVYANDKCDISFGTEMSIKHKPTITGERGDMIAVYAIAKFKDGSIQQEVMTKQDIDLIRARSKSSNSGPWVTDYEEMSRKTVVRRLCKYLPKSIEIEQAITAEEEGGAAGLSVSGMDMSDELIDATVVEDDDSTSEIKAAARTRAQKKEEPAKKEESPAAPSGERAELIAAIEKAIESAGTEIVIQFVEPLGVTDWHALTAEDLRKLFGLYRNA